jgi:hypothetical protein
MFNSLARTPPRSRLSETGELYVFTCLVCVWTTDNQAGPVSRCYCCSLKAKGLTERGVFLTIIISIFSGPTPYFHGMIAHRDTMSGFFVFAFHSPLARQLIFLIRESFPEDARVPLRDLLLELTASSVTAGLNKVILRKLFVAVRSCTSISTTCQAPHLCPPSRPSNASYRQ